MRVILLFVALPLAGSFLIALLSRRLEKFGDLLSSVAAFILFCLSLYCAKLVLTGQVISYRLGAFSFPLSITLVIDGLSALLLVIVNFVVFLSVVYSLKYMQQYTDKWKFHALFMLMLAGMNGVIISGDLFNLYVFLEVASISGYCLVAFGVGDSDLEAAFKYAIMGVFASVLILLGILLTYSYVSTLNMSDIANILTQRPKGLLISFISVLFLAGFGLKAAIVPFHAWLADAHSSAPSPVSATLSGVFIKTLGLYALMRVFWNVFGISSNILYILMTLGMLSMVIGAFLAIAQDDIKRMFAYSSISQVGYIVFALGIGTPFALLGAIFHLFNHAIFKSLLFLNAGAIEYATGKRNLSSLGGLSSKLGLTSFTSLLASMGISGIPPLGGFWSKLIIVIAAIQAGYIWPAFIAALVSIITLCYYAKFQTNAFFGRISLGERIKEIPASMKVPMLVLAIVSVFSGLLLLPEFRSFLDSAVNVLLSNINYIELISGVSR